MAPQRRRDPWECVSTESAHDADIEPPDAFLKNVFTVFNRNGTSDGGPAVGFTTLKS